METTKLLQYNWAQRQLIINFGLRNPQEKPSEYARSNEYAVRLIQSRTEYMKLQKLRYDVFHREFGGKKFPLGMDRDRYDSLAKHLIVTCDLHNNDKTSEKIIGTYRLIDSEQTNNFLNQGFYSGSEFDLANIEALAGNKIELSRACIHRKFRNGQVLNMLWRGIALHARRTQAKWLFGIPSVKSSNPIHAAAIYLTLKQKGWVSEELSVVVNKEFEVNKINDLVVQMENGHITPPQVPLPPLMLTYFRAGAKCVGLPAFDAAFGCFDFPVLLDLDQLSPGFKRRYFGA